MTVDAMPTFEDLRPLSSQWRTHGIVPCQRNLPEDCVIVSVRRVASAVGENWETCVEKIVLREMLVADHRVLEAHFTEVCLKFIDTATTNPGVNITHRSSFTVPRSSDDSRIMYLLQFRKTNMGCECFCDKVVIARKASTLKATTH